MAENTKVRADLVEKGDRVWVEVIPGRTDELRPAATAGKGEAGTVQRVDKQGTGRNVRYVVILDVGRTTKLAASKTFLRADLTVASAGVPSKTDGNASSKTAAKASSKADDNVSSNSSSNVSSKVAKQKATYAAAVASGERRVCLVCNEDKAITSFPTTAPNKDGIIGRGKTCRACRDRNRAPRSAKA